MYLIEEEFIEALLFGEIDGIREKLQQLIEKGGVNKILRLILRHAVDKGYLVAGSESAIAISDVISNARLRKKELGMESELQSLAQWLAFPGNASLGVAWMDVVLASYAHRSAASYAEIVEYSRLARIIDEAFRQAMYRDSIDKRCAIPYY